MVVFGGSKDVGFNRDISELTGTVRIARTGWQTARGGRSISADDIPVLRPEEVRQLPEKHALVVAENSRPIIARLTRCIDGRTGQQLLNQQRDTRQQLQARRGRTVNAEARAVAALAKARRDNEP